MSTAEATIALSVEDQLESRLRLPADGLRCVVACIGIALLAVIGLLARATVSGIETNVVGASQLANRKLLTGVLGLLGVLAHLALVALPLALAVLLIVRRQPRRLAEAVGAGVVAALLVVICNALLGLRAAAALHNALTLSAGGHVAVLDWYLASLAAYVTVIGLSGRPWRSAYWVALGFYVLASLANARNSHVTLLSLLVTLLIGSAVGSGLRYVFGAASERPTAVAIAAAISAVDLPVIAIRRVLDAHAETRRYVATVRGGQQRDVTVFDRDQQAAGALSRVVQRLRVKTQVSRSAVLTVERAVERRALLAFAVQDAGVATPQVRALVRVGPETAVLASDRPDGKTLAEQASDVSDDQLRQVWDAVLRLHRRRVTHRYLTADHILFARQGSDGQVSAGPGGSIMLLEPGDGDVAASDLQLRLDLVQLLAELAIVVGPDRAANLAAEKFSAAELASLVPLLQPVALRRSTRIAIREHKDVLPALRKRLLGATPDGEVAPVQLQRVRLRTVITLVAGVVAAYLLIGQLSKVSLGTVLRNSDWRWGALVVLLSVLTYVGAALELTGFVPERLSPVRTFLAQIAGSFVTLVTPAAVGGVALNIRYLRKANVSPADAGASVGVAQVIAFGLHLIMLIIFVTLTRTSTKNSLRPPTWVWIALAALAVVVLIVAAIPPGRRLLRSRLAPALGQIIPRLLDIAQRPVKLAQGIGGALLLTAAYIFCLDASTLALRGSVALASVAVVYLTGSAIGSVVPTPGGIGAVEAALSAGLVAAGMPGAKAVSAVLLFRLVTFWLPVPVGWVALNYLQRKDAL